MYTRNGRLNSMKTYFKECLSLDGFSIWYSLDSHGHSLVKSFSPITSYSTLNGISCGLEVTFTWWPTQPMYTFRLGWVFLLSMRFPFIWDTSNFSDLSVGYQLSSITCCTLFKLQISSYYSLSMTRRLTMSSPWSKQWCLDIILCYISQWQFWTGLSFWRKSALSCSLCLRRDTDTILILHLVSMMSLLSGGLSLRLWILWTILNGLKKRFIRSSIRNISCQTILTRLDDILI